MPLWIGRPAPGTARRLPALFVLALLCFGPTLVGPVFADHVGVPVDAGTLPFPLASSRALAVDGTVWIFGGGDVPTASSAILAFDPVTATTRVAASELPSPRTWWAAAAVDGIVYLFGGHDKVSTVFDDILRFDPATEELTVLPVSLPKKLYGLAAAADGGVIHVLGGKDEAGVVQSAIYTFDPAIPALVTRSATLPSALAFGSAVTLEGKVFLFGGHDGGILSYIHRFNPATDTADRLPNRLPVRAYHVGAAASDGSAYLFGGLTDWTVSLDSVYRFDGTSLIAQGSSLPQGRAGAAVAAIGRHLYVVGGHTAGSGGIVHDDILDFRITAPPVPAIAAIEDGECVTGYGTVSLDGSGSVHPEGLPLSYAWSVAAGTITASTSAMTTARLPLGTTTVRLDVSDGPHTETATATGRVVDSYPPLVAITDPEPGTVRILDLPIEHGQDQLPIIVVGDATVRAAASDVCGVAAVRFSSNGGPDVVDSDPPYTYQVAPPSVGPGLIEVVATAIDRAGRTASDSITFWMIADGPA